MLKKALSVFFSIMIIISGVCHFSGYDCSVSASKITIIASNEQITKKLLYDESKRRRHGIKKVVSHPFKIISNGAFLGGLVCISSRIIPRFSIKTIFIAGFIFGSVLKVLELYARGYNK